MTNEPALFDIFYDLPHISLRSVYRQRVKLWCLHHNCRARFELVLWISQRQFLLWLFYSFYPLEPGEKQAVESVREDGLDKVKLLCEREFIRVRIKYF